MKRFVLLLVVLCTFLCSCVGYAAKGSFLDGDWYDRAGNRVLSIHNGYLNDCQIVNFKGGAGSAALGGGTVTIVEGQGYRNINLGTRVLGDPHDYLIFNESVLHKANYAHYESVQGVYLGASKQDVVRAFGNPDRIDGNKYFSNYYYDRNGMDLRIEHGEVLSIALYGNSNLRFDRSGLNYNSSEAAYCRAYGLRVAGGIQEIGHTGEYLIFQENRHRIVLSSWPN
jgi:hypothetical protein